MLHLREIRLDDFAEVLTWSKNHEFCAANDWEQNREEQELYRWWHYCCHDLQTESFRRMGIAEGDQLIGYGDFVATDNGAMELGIAIGDSTVWGKGLGTAALKLMIEVAEKKFGMTKLLAETHATNARARGMLRKAGFREIARVDQEVYMGEITDLIQLELQMVNPPVEIRKYKPVDESDLRRLLALAGEGEDLFSLLNSPGHAYAYVAKVKAGMAGILVAWKSRFHPYSMYMKIISNPVYCAENVEERLLAMLERQSFQPRILQTSLWETSTFLRDVYEKDGFVEIRRTYMPKLQQLEAVVEPQKAVLDVKDGDLVSLSDLKMNPKMMNSFLRLVKKNYETSHLVNPVADLPLETWREMIFSDDVIEEMSFLYVEKASVEVLAYSMLHFSEEENAVELGWCGIADSVYTSKLHSLILHQIQGCIARGILEIIGEFDTTDPIAMAVLKQFPFEPAPAWITLQKK